MVLVDLSNGAVARDEQVSVKAREQLVPVLIAGNQQAADELCTVLDGMDVPALVGCLAAARVAPARPRGVPVLVPEEHYDRACEILACRDASLSDDDWEEDEEEDDDDFFDDDEDEDDDFLPDDDYDDDDDFEEEDED